MNPYNKSTFDKETPICVPIFFCRSYALPYYSSLPKEDCTQIFVILMLAGCRICHSEQSEETIVSNFSHPALKRTPPAEGNCSNYVFN